MKILYSPQFNQNDNLSYVFNGEKITATLNGKTDVFDFTSIPVGQVDNIQSTLPINVVLNAHRESDNTLHVVLLNFIGTNATQSELFPVEVTI